MQPDPALRAKVGRVFQSGRPLEVRKEVGQGLFDVICDQLDATFRDSPLAISFNIQEFHPELNYKQNNLHEHVRVRADRADRLADGGRAER